MFIFETFLNKEFFIESSGSRKIKYPEMKRILRGKGTIDSRTNFNSDDEITLTFTANDKTLLDYIKIYYLSSIFGMLHIRDFNLFETYIAGYLDYSKKITLDSFIDSLNSSNQSATAKQFNNDIEKYYSNVKTNCKGNFFAFVRSFSITSIPNTTNAYKIEFKLWLNYNSVKYIMSDSDFYKKYTKKLSKYNDKVTTMFQEIKEKYNLKNKDFIFKYCNKNVISTDSSDDKNTNADILYDYQYESFSLDEKYVDSIEIIINNNLIRQPLQNGTPNIQHLGKAECSLTVNMNFARDNIANNSEEYFINQDYYLKTMVKLKKFSNLNQNDYYFDNSNINQHFLLKTLELNSFSVQAIANNDIESDEFQLSNISIVFLANSYNYNELTENVKTLSENTSEKTMFSYLNSFNNFLSYYSLLDNNTTDYLTNDFIFADDGKTQLSMKKLLGYLNFGFFTYGKTLRTSVKIQYAVNDKMPLLKGINPLINVLYGFMMLNKSKNKTIKIFNGKESSIYERILSYLIPQMVQVTENSKEDLCNKIIFEVILTEWIYSFPNIIDRNMQNEDEDYLKKFKELLFNFTNESVKQSYIYNKAFSLLKIRLTSADNEILDNAKSYSTILKKQVKITREKFYSYYDNENSITNINLLKKIYIKLIELSFIENCSKNIWDVYDTTIMKRCKRIIEYLTPFFIGFWCNSTNYIGTFFQEVAFCFCRKFAIPIMVIENSTSESSLLYKTFLSQVLGENYTDLKALLKTTNETISQTMYDDYNYKFTNYFFWENEHPTDIINEILSEIKKNKHTDLYENYSLIKNINNILLNSKNYISEKDNQDNSHTPEIEKVQSTIIDDIQGNLDGISPIYSDTNQLADTLKNEFGWSSLGNKLIELLTGATTFMPVQKLEFAYQSAITNSLSEIPFFSLEEVGYSNKLTSATVTTNQVTKIKTATIQLVDVEELTKQITYNETKSLSNKNNVALKDSKIYKIVKKSIPLKIGTLIRLYFGNTYEDIDNVFAGSISKVSFDNGYINIVAESFAKELYNQDFIISTGKGGVGIFSNVVSMKNIKNLILNNNLVNIFTKGDSYKSQILQLLKNNTRLNSDKILKPHINPNSSWEYNSAQNIIALSALISSNSLRYLDSSFYLKGTNKTLLSAIENEKNLLYRATAGKDYSSDNSRIIENVYNVDYDIKHYGIGKHSKKLVPFFLNDFITILITFFMPEISLTRLPVIGKAVTFLFESSNFLTSISKKSITTLLTKGANISTKFEAKSLEKIFNYLGNITTKTSFKSIYSNYLYAALSTNIISSVTHEANISDKKLRASDDYKKFGFNISSYIPGFVKLHDLSETASQNEVKEKKTIGDNKLSGAVSYTYSTKDNFGGVLNDMARRYQSVEWDILESGGYGTLFFGRVDYEYYINKFKNKTSKLRLNTSINNFNKIVESGPLKSKDQLRNISINNFVKITDFLNVINSNYIKSSVNTEANEYGEEADAIIKTTVTSNETEKFRNTTVAISGVNLISCTIITNKEFKNAIEIEYDYSAIGEWLINPIKSFEKVLSKDINMGSYTLRSFYNLPDHFMRVKKIDKIFTKNINSEYQARESAASFMEKEYRNYYDGKIILTFDSSIKRGTEIIICDTVNKIFGSIIAKEVTHSFDGKNGLVTIVTPGMKTECRTPSYNLAYSNILTRTMLFLEKFKNNNTMTLDTINSVNKIFEIIRAKTTLPFIFNFGLDAYSINRKDHEINGEVSTEFGQISTAPLIIYPLFVKDSMLMPDQKIYNAFARKYDIINLFYLGIERMLLETGKGIGYAISGLWYKFTDFISESATTISDIFTGASLELSELKKINNKYFASNDIENNYIKELSKNLYDNIDSSGIAQKVYEKFLKLNPTESFNLDTNELLFVNPLTNKSYGTSKIVAFNNLKAFEYDITKKDQYYNTFFALAKKTINCDIICFTELKNLNNETYKRIVDIFKLFRELSNNKKALTNITPQKETLTKVYHGSNGYKEHGICLTTGDKITRKHYKDKVSLINKEDNIRYYFEVTAETSCYPDVGFSYITKPLEKEKGYIKINLLHTFFGGSVDTSNDQAKATMKRQNLYNLFNNLTGNNVIMGDFNFNIVTDIYYVSQMMSYISITDSIFGKYNKYKNLGLTTQGLNSYDNIVFNEECNKYITNAYSTDVNFKNKFAYSDHKMIVLELQ